MNTYGLPIKSWLIHRHHEHQVRTDLFLTIISIGSMSTRYVRIWLLLSYPPAPWAPGTYGFDSYYHIHRLHEHQVRTDLVLTIISTGSISTRYVRIWFLLSYPPAPWAPGTYGFGSYYHIHRLNEHQVRTDLILTIISITAVIQK